MILKSSPPVHEYHNRHVQPPKSQFADDLLLAQQLNLLLAQQNLDYRDFRILIFKTWVHRYKGRLGTSVLTYHVKTCISPGSQSFITQAKEAGAFQNPLFFTARKDIQYLCPLLQVVQPVPTSSYQKLSPSAATVVHYTNAFHKFENLSLIQSQLAGKLYIVLSNLK